MAKGRKFHCAASFASTWNAKCGKSPQGKNVKVLKTLEFIDAYNEDPKGCCETCVKVLKSQDVI